MLGIKYIVHAWKKLIIMIMIIITIIITKGRKIVVIENWYTTLEFFQPHRLYSIEFVLDEVYMLT